MCYCRNTGSLCLSLLRPPGAWMPTSCTSGGHCFLFNSCGSIFIICHDCHLLICVLQLRVWNPGEPKGKSNFVALFKIVKCSYSRKLQQLHYKFSTTPCRQECYLFKKKQKKTWPIIMKYSMWENPLVFLPKLTACQLVHRSNPSSTRECVNVEMAARPESPPQQETQTPPTLPQCHGLGKVWSLHGVRGQICTYRLPPATPAISRPPGRLCLCLSTTRGPRRALGRARDTQTLTCRQQRFG